MGYLSLPENVVVLTTLVIRTDGFGLVLTVTWLEFRPDPPLAPTITRSLVGIR